MINLHEVGAFASAPTESGVDVQFGVYLLGIEPQAGYEVLVRVMDGGADGLKEGEVVIMGVKAPPGPAVVTTPGASPFGGGGGRRGF